MIKRQLPSHPFSLVLALIMVASIPTLWPVQGLPEVSLGQAQLLMTLIGKTSKKMDDWIAVCVESNKEWNNRNTFFDCSPDSPQLDLHRTLSVEDIMPSRVVRPAGRVSQAFPDGSLLLELIRPPNGPFGFVISRGKGRPDTGTLFTMHINNMQYIYI